MVSIDDRLNAIIRELIGNGITLEQAVEAFEGKYIVAAMTASKGNVTQASRKLGVHRNTLHNKLRTQTMLNGFAESVRPVRRRVSHKRSHAPATRPSKISRTPRLTESRHLARSLAVPQRPELHQAIIQLLRQRGNRLLGSKEIHERLDDPDVTRMTSIAPSRISSRTACSSPSRGKRYSLLEFTPYHAGTIKVFNDGHGNVLGGPGNPDIYIERKAMKGAMNGDLVVVRVDKRNPKIRRVREREYIDGEVIRRSSVARIARWSAASMSTSPIRTSSPSTSASTTTSSSITTRRMDARDGEMVNVESIAIPIAPARSPTVASWRSSDSSAIPASTSKWSSASITFPHHFPEDVMRGGGSDPDGGFRGGDRETRRSARAEHRHHRRRDGEGLRRRRRSAAPSERQLSSSACTSPTSRIT